MDSLNRNADPVYRAAHAAVDALVKVLALTLPDVRPDPPAVTRALDEAAAALAEAQAAHARARRAGRQS